MSNDSKSKSARKPKTEANKIEEPKVETPIVDTPKEEKPKIINEVVEAGVTRKMAKENPMDLVDKAIKIRPKGNWKKVSVKELAKLEADGLLVGYDQKTQEVLIKEK